MPGACILHYVSQNSVRCERAFRIQGAWCHKHLIWFSVKNNLQFCNPQLRTCTMCDLDFSPTAAPSAKHWR